MGKGGLVVKVKGHSGCAVMWCRVRSRVSWRFARGVITSDDRLFSRLEVPGLDRVVLEPASEHHAGTSSCRLWDVIGVVL